MTYQRIEIIGNLGRDPEMRYMPDGTGVTNMTVATNKQWKDKATGEDRKVTTWFRVSVWGRQAEAVAEYMKQGSQVFVAGELVTDTETGGPKLFTRQDGSVGASFEIRSFEVKFLQGKSESVGSHEDGQIEAQEEDEIPF